MMAVTGALVAISLIALAVFAGLIVLQVFLSNKESKVLGLILPGLFFTGALVVLIAILLFTPVTSTSTGMVNGEIIIVEETINQPTAIIATAVATFFMLNVPTIVLLIIYAACRSKQNRIRALDKMSVQDLE